MSTTGCEMCQIAIYRPNMAGNKGVAAVAYSSNETLDLTGANRIVFFAKGELGGERLTFSAIGRPSESLPSTAPFTNITFALVTTNITLANDWTRYELSLNGTDLTNIEYPFGFIVERGRNNSALEQPDGDNPPLNNPSTSQITLYLKGITFDTDPAESPLNATTTGQALNATTTGQALNATTTGQALNATTTGQALNATTTGQVLMLQRLVNSSLMLQRLVKLLMLQRLVKLLMLQRLVKLLMLQRLVKLLMLQRLVKLLMPNPSS